MNRILFLLAPVLYISLANGQELKKVLLAGSVGYCMPVGNFSDTDIENQHAGFARPCLAYDFSFYYRLGSHLGLAADFKGISNAMDEYALTDAINQYSGISWSADAGNWSSQWFTLGLYASFPGPNTTSYFLKLLFGPVTGTLPEIYYSSSPGPNKWTQQSGDKSSGFGYLAGFGQKSDLGSNLCIVIGIDFVHTALDFDINGSTSTGYVFSSTNTQYISAFSFNLGLGLKI